MNPAAKLSTNDHLDTVQSGITDAYEALCLLADAGNVRASVLRDALRVAFAVSTNAHRVVPGLHAYTPTVVVGAVDAMREQPERDIIGHAYAAGGRL